MSGTLDALESRQLNGIVVDCQHSVPVCKEIAEITPSRLQKCLQENHVHLQLKGRRATFMVQGSAATGDLNAL